MVTLVTTDSVGRSGARPRSHAEPGAGTSAEMSAEMSADMLETSALPREIATAAKGRTMRRTTDDGPGGLGIVISGAGARGAYEIGALSVLIPWLRRHGQAPRVVVGTSAGAINAVLVAALCSAPDPEAAAETAVASWRGIGRADVFRSIAVSSPGVLARYVATVLGLARPPFQQALSVTSLLDPAPLRRTLAELGPWRQLHSAVRSGAVRSVAVVTTSYSGGSTAIFVETADGERLPPHDVDRGIEYHRARLTPDHLMASAAIPLAFPPVRLGPPGDDATRNGAHARGAAEGTGVGWHFDGGVRLNAPIKPSLDLGADRLVVVATHPLPEFAAPPPDADRSPDVMNVAASLLTSVLVDRMAQDVRSLDRVNRLVAAGATDSGYRLVPYLFAAPDRADRIGRIAEEVLRTTYGGLPSLENYDYAVLTRLLGGSDASHAEIMSFLLFDPDYIDALIDAGQRDAAVAIHAAVPDDLFRISRRADSPRTAPGPP